MSRLEHSDANTESPDLADVFPELLEEWTSEGALGGKKGDISDRFPELLDAWNPVQ